MAEVTKEDINTIHRRLDSILEEQTLSRIAIGQIETTIKLMPLPQPRPCPQHIELRADFDEHIENHKETKRLWEKPIVGMLIHLIELGIVALLTWFFLS